MDPVQDAIEKLAQSLRRSVAVDDADLRLVASSTHFDDADPARLQSLVGRRVEGAARDYVYGAGVRRWRTPHRLPANPDVGAAMTRVCFPLWSRFELLGFVWVMEASPLAEGEMAAAEATATSVRELLARKAEQEAEYAQEVESLAFGLLSTAPAERSAAAADLRDLRLFRDASRFTAIAAVITGAVYPADENPTTLIRRAFAYIQQSRFERTSAAAVSEDGGFLVFGHRAEFTSEELRDICRRVLAELHRLHPEFAATVSLGVGGTRGDLDDIAVSFDQGRVAARTVHGDDRVAVWGDDPVAAFLGAAIRTDIDHRMIPAVLTRIGRDHRGVIPVLTAYLDHAGNVIRTAESLHLHRTTVYYRLTKFQEATGLDLENGSVRLMLHLWLRTCGPRPA